MGKEMRGETISVTGIGVFATLFSMETWSMGFQRLIVILLLVCAAGGGLGGCAGSGRPRTPLATFEHSTVLDETPTRVDGGAVTIGPVHGVVHGFSEAILSVNADVPAGTGLVAEIRVGQTADDFWSPWMPIVAWGEPVAMADDSALTFGAAGETRAGKLEIDTFVGRAAGGFDRVQHRFRGVTPDGKVIVVRRVAICTTRETGERAWDDVVSANTPASTATLNALRLRKMDVPFLSQATDRPELSGRLCSPTSVSMVLAYRGKRKDVLDVANCAFDGAHDIYGNWPRNVQAAYVMGVKGYLTRVSTWKEVEAFVSRGTPLVISIRVNAGELPAAPYSDTDGHLIVLTGFAGNGDVTVNDPAVRDAAEGRRVYPRADLERVWMSNGAGTAYVLGE